MNLPNKPLLIKQADLTGECWMVQFLGLTQCGECEYLGTSECGGQNIIKTGLNSIGKPVPVSR